MTVAEARAKYNHKLSVSRTTTLTLLEFGLKHDTMNPAFSDCDVNRCLIFCCCISNR